MYNNMSVTCPCPEINTDLVPECCLKFKFTVHYTGSATTTSNPITVVAGTPNYSLELCCPTTKLKIPCANGTKRIILGLPLTYVKGCYVYSIIPPLISSSQLLFGPPYNANLIVSDVNTSAVLPIGMQIANGYLFVEIDVDGKIVNDDEPVDGECSGHLTLHFDKFDFPLNRKMKCCDIPCKPVIWNYSDTDNAIND